MKKALFLAAALSASAALAACDRADNDPASMTGAPAGGDSSVVMPSPAPETAPAAPGGTMGDGTTGGAGTGTVQ